MIHSQAFIKRALFLILMTLCGRAAGYFKITAPVAATQWPNGQAQLIAWEKGLQDGVDSFDIEMARLSSDGLLYIAKNVASAKTDTKALNIVLQDIPLGDDYFLLFLNSTHGGLYCISDRFTVISSSTTPNSSNPSTNADVPTVTISGAPNPTMNFATTLAGLADSALGTFLVERGVLVGIVISIAACVLGGASAFW